MGLKLQIKTRKVAKGKSGAIDKKKAATSKKKKKGHKTMKDEAEKKKVEAANAHEATKVEEANANEAKKAEEASANEANIEEMTTKKQRNRSGRKRQGETRANKRTTRVAGWRTWEKRKQQTLEKSKVEPVEEEDKEDEESNEVVAKKELEAAKEGPRKEKAKQAREREEAKQAREKNFGYGYRTGYEDAREDCAVGYFRALELAGKLNGHEHSIEWARRGAANWAYEGRVERLGAASV